MAIYTLSTHSPIFCINTINYRLHPEEPRVVFSCGFNVFSACSPEYDLCPGEKLFYRCCDEASWLRFHLKGPETGEQLVVHFDLCLGWDLIWSLSEQRKRIFKKVSQKTIFLSPSAEQIGFLRMSKHSTWYCISVTQNRALKIRISPRSLRQILYHGEFNENVVPHNTVRALTCFNGEVKSFNTVFICFFYVWKQHFPVWVAPTKMNLI